jgi:ATP adenylyltransferase
MNHLHAYWRMAYIEAPRAPKTKRPFSALPALGDDRTALIIHRAPLSYLMLNCYPYNPGHLMAIPYREVTDIEDLTPDESADLFRTITHAKQLLRLALNPDAYNIGFNLGSAAGGSIPHLHCHIVPRWNGDTNFMPVLAETRVLPQALEAMWEKLHAKTKKIRN